jgi:lipoprotein NlpI
MGTSGTAIGFMLLVACSALADEAPQTAAEYVSRGMRRFREGKVAESLRDFDRAAELDPPTAPYLWQRGISDYYAGQFKKGREQFESHKRVNPDDVENAAWHFLCVARTDGIQAARKSLIPIDVTRDSRVPMSEIYELYAGRGSVDVVTKAAEKANTEQARMYAHLYLGLYYEAAGKTDAARTEIRQAAAAKLRDDYMHDVAKVHLREHKWER